MTCEQISDMLSGIGLPFAYHHFAEGESPDPPFCVYLTPGSNNFAADGKVYYKIKQLDIELYTDQKDPAMEERLEAALDASGIFHEKTEAYIESERLYEVLYEMEV
ncbi:MAG: hypothetical protein ACI3XY_07170 [Butyricicoccaceae bacterium]